MSSESVAYDQEALPRWEERLRKIMLVIVRIALGYLFFTQLFWKLPPTFGCPADFSFTTSFVDDNGRWQLRRTSGLCDWMGIEEVYSTEPRPWLVTNLDNQGEPEINVGLGIPAKINGFLIRNVFMPTIQVTGWLVWLAEFIIFASLVFGAFSRLGGLVAIAISAQLMVGLSGIPRPYEWEWSYNSIFLLSLLMFAFAPGRVFGIDAWLRPRLLAAKERGNRFAGILSWLT
jgi:uncharacterized membrane protein YphA (DoxX/SURF4 family)